VEILITAGIDYKNDLSVFNVYMSCSSSTEGSTELHLIANWNFSRTFGFLPLNPNPNPTVIPISNTANKHHKILVFDPGIVGPVILCAFLMFLVIFLSRNDRRFSNLQCWCKFLKNLCGKRNPIMSWSRRIIKAVSRFQYKFSRTRIS
jgi:hypothetical protein